MKRIIAVLFAFGAALTVASVSEAAVFCVDDFGDGPVAAADCAATCDGTNDCSLRDAVTAASLNAEADEIALSAGTYTLSEVGTTGLEIFEEVTISGAGPWETTVDGNGFTTSSRVFHVLDGSKLTLSGLTVTDGRDEADGGGGGILSIDAELVLTDVVINQNFSTFHGGGVLVFNGSLTATDTVFSDNIADSDAGGSVGSGGGLHVGGSADVSLVRTTFFSNEANGGAGLNLDLSGGTATVSDSSFVDNTSGISGGGMSSFATGGATVVVEGSTFRGNHGLFGGGLLANDGDLILRNTTLSGNVASVSGGGLYVFSDGIVTANNLTVTLNNASNGATGDGGGIGVAATASLTLSNSIVAHNFDAGADAPDCFGNVASGGHNLLNSEAGCTFTVETGDLIGVDPLLEELAENGGPAQTHLPLAGSPALDAGGDDCESKDQRGEARPTDGNGDGTAICDIGAVEAPTAPAGTGGTTGGGTTGGSTGGSTTGGSTAGTGGENGGGCSLIR
ncbi:MAG TPA: choice-of-anchor Q domain-containing protein [bacterium]|nr:choice-of-anchor Q domain-containing protein [bacterium]